MAERLEVRCPYCDKKQPMCAWLAAHWYELVTGKCCACKKSFRLRAGVSRKMKQPQVAHANS